LIEGGLGTSCLGRQVRSWEELNNMGSEAEDLLRIGEDLETWYGFCLRCRVLEEGSDSHVPPTVDDLGIWRVRVIVGTVNFYLYLN
jgi:hypothetical protein